LGIAASIVPSVLLEAPIAAGRHASAYVRSDEKDPEQDAQRNAKAMKELVVGHDIIRPNAGRGGPRM
jgi:hypothetical protein